MDTDKNQNSADPMKMAAVKAQAVQDQEIAQCADWLKHHMETDDVEARMRMVFMFDTLNDANVNNFRRFTDDEIKVVCAMAMIGWMEGMASNERRDDGHQGPALPGGKKETK